METTRVVLLSERVLCFNTNLVCKLYPLTRNIRVTVLLGFSYSNYLFQQFELLEDTVVGIA